MIGRFLKALLGAGREQADPVPAAAGEAVTESMDKRPIRVAITDTQTGETRTYDDKGIFEDGRFEPWIWEDGNYACDCNRGLFFAAVNGEDDPNRKCGDERYVVRITDPAGVILYDETEES